MRKELIPPLYSALIGAVLLFAVGCDAPSGQTRMSIEEVRAFDEFQLYWLGEEFGDLPLTRIIRREPDEDADIAQKNSVSFVYGDCQAAGGGESGCAVPMTVNVEPTCSYYGEYIFPLTTDNLVGRSGGTTRSVRGVPAHFSVGGSVVVWTGDVTVFVAIREDIPIRIEDAIDGLITVSDTATNPQANLPAPDFSGCPAITPFTP